MLDWATVLAAPAGSVLLLYLLLASGKLETKRSIDRAKGIQDAAATALAESNRHRLADKEAEIARGLARETVLGQINETYRGTIDQQNRQLLAVEPLMELLQKVLRSLPPMGGGGPGGGS